MNLKTWLPTLHSTPVIAVLRATCLDTGLHLAKAAAAGGLSLIEITWNSDRAPELIQQLRHDLPHCHIGAGTLLTLEDLQQAIAAGAGFLFTPHVDVTLIQAAIAHDLPLVAGALSPTEIIRAWQAGAASVKVFPIQAVGGYSYIQSLQGPLGMIPLIPTGGVTLANTNEFLRAGAVAVGLSGDLFPSWAVQSGNWQEITNRAQTLLQQLAKQRPPTPV